MVGLFKKRLTWEAYDAVYGGLQESRVILERTRVDLAKAEMQVAGLTVVRDQMERQYLCEITALRDQLAKKDEAILALRRDGFDPPDPRPPTTHEMRAKLDPAILHAIEQIAQPGTKEHFVMLQEAEALVGAYPDRPAEQIADEVTEGCPISPYRL